MHIAICYWGLTRSTRHVFSTHHENIFKPLNEKGIEYTTFMHTWKTDQNIVWEHDCEIPNDYEEYQLLAPHYYQIEDQDSFSSTLCFSDYYYEGEQDEWLPQLIKNHLCALESQRRVWKMVLETGKKFDYVMFVRPDMRVHTVLDVSLFSMEPGFDVCIPSYHHFEGFNDRFAILPFEKGAIYAERIGGIVEFRKTQGRIVSEKYLKYVIDSCLPCVQFTDLYMTIVRPKGG